jgi:hypothetical protein
MKTRNFDTHTVLSCTSELELKHWVYRFLELSENPNIGLLEAIKNRDGFFIGPFLCPTDKLCRFPFHICEDKCNDIINSFTDIRDFPPIITRCKNKKLDITDGNHRHRSFQLLNIDLCWIIIELGTLDSDD